jgi:hypothetical protein
MSATDFTVSDETGTYEVSMVRSKPSAYELSIANGETVQRDLLASVGILRRAHCSDADLAAWRLDKSAPCFELPQGTVDAFNAWRAAEHAADIASMEAQRERYGVILANDTCRTPPMIAKRGHYRAGIGWIVTDLQLQAA